MRQFSRLVINAKFTVLDTKRETDWASVDIKEFTSCCRCQCGLFVDRVARLIAADGIYQVSRALPLKDRWVKEVDRWRCYEVRNAVASIVGNTVKVPVTRFGNLDLVAFILTFTARERAVDFPAPGRQEVIAGTIIA